MGMGEPTGRQGVSKITLIGRVMFQTRMTTVRIALIRTARLRRRRSRRKIVHDFGGINALLTVVGSRPVAISGSDGGLQGVHCCLLFCG
jgi:hypothetical protein